MKKFARTMIYKANTSCLHVGLCCSLQIEVDINISIYAFILSGRFDSFFYFIGAVMKSRFIRDIFQGHSEIKYIFFSRGTYFMVIMKPSTTCIYSYPEGLVVIYSISGSDSMT